jgi:hypothetical protein
LREWALRYGSAGIYWESDVVTSDRILAALLLFLAVTFMGGCSVVRMASMEAVGRTEIPVPAGGKRLSSDAQGFVSYPSVEVRIHCPMPPEETLAWYRDRLVAEGWVLRKENEGWMRTYGTMNGHNWYFASRKRWQWGTDWLLKEDLELVLEEGEGDAIVRVKIVGDYVWDWPGRAVYSGVGTVMMPLVYAAYGFVSATHTEFIGQVIFLGPLYVPAVAIMVVL